MLDLTAYGDFVRECGVKRVVLVGDKGFPAGVAAEQKAWTESPDIPAENNRAECGVRAKVARVGEDGELRGIRLNPSLVEILRVLGLEPPDGGARKDG